MNGHVNIETQNPHKIRDIALQSLEEYRDDLEEEEDRQERKKAKTKSKVRRVVISFLCTLTRSFFHILIACQRTLKTWV